jgi:hypothetical protein
MNVLAAFEVLDHYRIDHVLVQSRQPLSYLLKHTPGWKETMREKSEADDYVLYAREPVSEPAASGSKTQ